MATLKNKEIITDSLAVGERLTVTGGSVVTISYGGNDVERVIATSGSYIFEGYPILIMYKIAAREDLTFTETAMTDDVQVNGNIDFKGNLTTSANHIKSVQAGITADTGSIQDGSPLTKDINEISTCVNIGDAVTMPPAAAGLNITIINNGATAADVFPASGDTLNGGTVNVAEALAAGAKIHYESYNGTDWETV